MEHDLNYILLGLITCFKKLLLLLLFSVKRAHPDLLTSEENGGDVPYYGKPSAIKRG